MVDRDVNRRMLVVCGAITVALFALIAPSAMAKSPAVCAPGDKPETGLQGQVPRADQLSGRALEGYNCALKLIGQDDLLRRGANLQLAWAGHCVYVGGALQPGAQDPYEGVGVIDVADPSKPRFVRFLSDPLGGSGADSIEANSARGVLAISLWEPKEPPLPVAAGLSARYVRFWDASKDCTNPVMRGTFDSGSANMHGLKLSRDGRTAYSGDMYVIDISDLDHPRQLMLWEGDDKEDCSVHDLDVSPEGNRLYVACGAGGGPFAIVDSSDVQQRRPNPRLRIISTGSPANPSQGGHTAAFVRIAGRPYVVNSAEQFASCPSGSVSIFDISDEKRPDEVGSFQLEVNDPANCEQLRADQAAAYGTHYLGFDSPCYGDNNDDASPNCNGNATTLFYSWFNSGVRVIDIRDPSEPSEIAYFNPAGADTATYHFNPLSAPGVLTALFNNPYLDVAGSSIRYTPRDNRIWFVSMYKGLQIVEPEYQIGGLGTTATTASAGPVPGAVDRGRGCGIGRIVTLKIPKLKRLGKVTVNGRRAPAKRLSRNRVRITLPATRAPRYSIRITGRTARNRRASVRRRIAACRQT